ncbi:MAG: hypothetical protein HQK77_19720 [Desulfobacterales bacterium]|nr:hypothetical protein [Desulfobacterales bacterium]
MKLEDKGLILMNYKLEYISEDDFERLVNMICHEILGCGIIEFSKGKDGGLDGKLAMIIIWAKCRGEPCVRLNTRFAPAPQNKQVAETMINA